MHLSYGISYDDILRLDECGLVNSSGIISGNMEVGTEEQILLDFEDYILMCKSSEGVKQEISIGEFPLTQAGKELLPVAKTSKYGEDYIRDVVSLVKKQAYKCEVTLHKVNYRNENGINYEKTETVLSNPEDE